MNDGNWLARLKGIFIGRARDLSDKQPFHKVSLIAMLAWGGEVNIIPVE